MLTVLRAKKKKVPHLAAVSTPNSAAMINKTEDKVNK
jgi:hypothetical protein